jgi:hypothetical protein
MKKKPTALLALLILFSTAIFAVGSGWRKMSEKELRSAVPERAPVINERIETEFRTASGITDSEGHRIYGVVIITAGYEAEGKYTHFFKTQTGLKIGDFKLEAGEYVFGYKRMDTDSLLVTFYRASNGETVGSVRADVERKKGPIYSFLIEPPTNDNGAIRIGRFVMAYSIA